MASYTPSKSLKKPRALFNMVQVYLLALGLIMVLAVGKYIANEALISTQESAASVVNLSGRQRMLSQRTALFAQSYFHEDNISAKELAEQNLRNTIQEFETNHQLLIEGSERLNIEPLKNSRVEKIYFEGEDSINSLLRLYIEQVETLLENKGEGPVSAAALASIMNIGSSTLLDKLDNVVRLHEEKSRQDVAYISKIQMLFLGMTALILALEGMLLFRPLTLSIGKYIQDIKERERVIADQYNELERFTFIATHNLQEPLRKITGFADRLQRGLPEQPNEKHKEYLAFILQGTSEMRELVEGLAAYARVCSHPLEIAKIDTKEAVNQVLRGLDRQIKEHNATVNYANLPEIYYDEKMFIWIIEQLVKNALAYKSDADPVISISASQIDEEWRFEVQDNGMGIKKEYQTRIFEMFQKLHNRKEKPGSGAGLALARKLIERSGGTLDVISEAGAGSRFYFTIKQNLGTA